MCDHISGPVMKTSQEFEVFRLALLATYAKLVLKFSDRCILGAYTVACGLDVVWIWFGFGLDYVVMIMRNIMLLELGL